MTPEQRQFLRQSAGLTGTPPPRVLPVQNDANAMITRLRQSAGQQEEPVIETPATKKLEAAGGLKGFATGFAKGGLESAISTAKLVETIGKGVMAAVSPTKTFKDVSEQTGFPSLKNEEIDAMLKAENTAEKAGKLTEFIAELINPVGKTKEVQAGLTKGKELLDLGIEKGKDVLKKGKEMLPSTTGASESIIANVNRINPTKRKQFEMQQGMSEEKWLSERGIIGTRKQTVTQLAQNFDALRKNVDEALEKIPGNHRDSRITIVADEASDMARKTESSQAKRMSDLAEKAQGEGLTTKEINEVKRFYERNVKVAYLKDPSQSAVNGVRATNRDSGIREALFEIADKGGFPELRAMNKEIQANKFLGDEIAGKMEGQGANNALSLTDWISIAPGLVDPTYLSVFFAKKAGSLESVRAFAAKALAGFPKVKPLPRANLAEIEKRASELLKRTEDVRVETQKNALLADELQKAGFTMSTGNKAFITENPIPLTRNEQVLIQAAKNRAEQQAMVQYILEQRANGKAVGQNFTIQDIDNTPILNPQARFAEPAFLPDTFKPTPKIEF